MAEHSILEPTVVIGTLGLLLSIILQIVGTATTYWIAETGHMGLFKTCPKGYDCVEITQSESWLDAVRAFEILSILSGFGAGILLAVFCVQYRNNAVKTKTIPVLELFLCIGSGGSSLLGCFIFMAKLSSLSILINGNLLDYLDYSFYLCITAGVLFIIVGIILIVGMSKLVTMAMTSHTGQQSGTVITGYPQQHQPHMQQMTPGVYYTQQPGVVVQNPYQPHVANPYAPNPAPMAYIPPNAGPQAQASYPAQSPDPQQSNSSKQ